MAQKLLAKKEFPEFRIYKGKIISFIVDFKRAVDPAILFARAERQIRKAGGTPLKFELLRINRDRYRLIAKAHGAWQLPARQVADYIADSVMATGGMVIASRFIPATVGLGTLIALMILASALLRRR